MLRSIYIFLVCIIASCDLWAQEWPSGFTHDTRPSEQWLSCTPSANPNTQRGESYWLMFDLGYTYPLTNSTIWNYNVPGDGHMGATRLAVDYSLDGQVWQSWGEIHLDTATGRRDYAGQAGPDFTGTRIRFVLFTVLETAQMPMRCAGLGEVRFNLDQTVTSTFPREQTSLKIFPNPTFGPVELEVPGIRPERIFIYDDQGKLLLEREAKSEKVSLNLKSWLPGLYLIRLVGQNGQHFEQKLVLK